MRSIIKFALLTAACMVFLQSGWISYSGEKECPWPPKQDQARNMTVKENFMAAHGLTQDNFSIWLKEHSAWRRKYSEDLKDFTFIPKDYDTERK